MDVLSTNKGCCHGDGHCFSADDDEIVECDNCGISVHEGKPIGFEQLIIMNNNNNNDDDGDYTEGHNLRFFTTHNTASSRAASQTHYQ